MSSAPSDCLKVVLVGASAVGKSSLLLRLVSDAFKDEYDETIHEEFKLQSTVDGKSVTLEVQDTSGSDEFAAMRAEWVSGNDVALLVYAVDNHASFDAIGKFREAIVAANESDESVVPPMVLVANKCDLATGAGAGDAAEDAASGVSVSVEDGKALAKAITAVFVQASAKTGDNVAEAFHEGIRRFWKEEEKRQAALRKGTKKCIVM